MKTQNEKKASQKAADVRNANANAASTGKVKKTAEEVAAAAAERYEKHVTNIAAAAVKAGNWRNANGAGNMASKQQKAAALNAAAAIYEAIENGKKAEEVAAAAVTYLKGVIIAAAEGDLKATISAVGEAIPAEVLAAAVAIDGAIKPHNVARRMAAAIAANEETAIAVEIAARKAEKAARHAARKAEKKAAAAAKKTEKKA